MCNTNNTYRLFALKNAFMAKTDIVTKYQKMEKKTIHWYIWLIVCSDVFKGGITELSRPGFSIKNLVFGVALKN